MGQPFFIRHNFFAPLGVLAPWWFISGSAAAVSSLGLVALAGLIIGLVLAQATGRSKLRSVLRQLVVSMGAAGVTYAIGTLVR